MSITTDLHELDRYRQRRAQRERNQHLLRNLPLALRLASARANLLPGTTREEWLEQAVVGLVEAADRYDGAETHTRFGLYATPFIRAALDRDRDEFEIDHAHAEIAAAIASQARVRELAEFLDCPVEALVGGLMDVVAEDGDIRDEQLLGVA